MKEQFTVSVTGHRPNRLVIGLDRLSRRIEQVLDALREGSAERPRHAVSALAEGADRLFAEVALALGYTLDVVLPFASADYETTFCDASTTGQYRGLLARAATRVELAGSVHDSKAAYEAGGHATVARAQVMVAVWDGKPAAGRGGSPEIIAHALGQGRPVIWIDAVHDRPPMILRARSGMPLPTLARDAQAATHREIAELAGAPDHA